MIRSFVGVIRGVVSLLLYFVNTLFWGTQIFLVAFLKFVVPLKGWRKFCNILLNGIANNWIAVNNFNQRCTARIRWDVEGLDGLNRNEWYLVLSNHQSWVDILVLQRYLSPEVSRFSSFFSRRN